MNTRFLSLGTLALVALGGLLSACGTGRTMVVQPIEETRSFQSVTVERAADTVVVPEEYSQQFITTIREQLYGTPERAGPFTEGPGLTIRITVVQFDKGNQFSRWFWGGIGNAGEGSLQVRGEFFDGEVKLAQIQSEGRIGSGAFGGSMMEAVKKAAEEIAKYATDNFR
jgi:hypothetical protein